MSGTQTGQTLADQHAAAADYISWLYGSKADRIPALGSTAATGGHVADGGSYGGGATAG